MKAFDLVVMAKGNLVRKRMRTFLTVLGIVIGTVSIILMIAIGIGLKKNIAKKLNTMGSLDIIEVFKGDHRNRQTRLSEEKGYDKLQEIDLTFLESIEGVKDVAPIIYSNAKIISEVYETNALVLGIQPDKMASMGFTLKEGKLLDGSKMAAVFGPKAINNFKKVTGKGFLTNRELAEEIEEVDEEVTITDDDGENPFAPKEYTNYKVDIFNDRMKMTMDGAYSIQSGNSQTLAKIYPIKGVGILTSGDMMRRDKIFMDYEQVLKMNKEYGDIFNIKAKSGFDEAFILVKDISEVKEIKKKIEKKSYETFSMTTVLESINKTLGSVQVALGAIGGISLLVAAIGITNTMVMAISERRKEIGVMKVIGATIDNIKQLFLLEAAMIGGIGGAVGIGICVGLTKLISSSFFATLVTGKTTTEPILDFIIPLWLIISGLTFTTLVGILSGYLPARKAMRNSALEALRTE